MNYAWILGSGSPRRSELLKTLGLDFRIVKPDVDELDAEFYNPEELVLINARMKSEKIAESERSACILTADTTVALGEEIFNKPRDLSHAKAMLKRLSGKTHTVYTGVVFRSPESCWEFVEASHVTFKPYDDAMIEEYLSTIEPLDKAGAYAIQDGGERIVESYEGSYTNIVGLPIDRLKGKLVEAGLISAN